MLHLDDIFDRIFIINLERMVERRKKMIREMASNDIFNYEFFNAIDGALLDRQWLFDAGLLGDLELGTGEIGCALSHISTWRLAAARQYDRILVMEDDARFDNKASIIAEYYQEIPDDWDIIHYHSTKTNVDRRIIGPNVWAGDDEYGGSVCYALTRRGYLRLIENNLVINEATDGMTATLTRRDASHVGYVTPNVCWYDGSDGSEISRLGRKYK